MFGNLFKRKKKINEEKIKSEDINLAEEIVPEKDMKQEDLELVAVISACLAQSLNVSLDKLIVRSIRKVPLWIDSGRLEEQK